MFFHLSDVAVLLHVILAYPVSIELSIWATKFVFRFLAIVVFQIWPKSRHHVCMGFACSDCWNHLGTGTLHQCPRDAPAWEHYQHEVREEEEPASFTILDPHGMQVHVEFWSEISIDNWIDILQVIPSGVLVERVWLRIGSVEGATSASASSYNLCRPREDGWCTMSAASHQLRH